MADPGSQINYWLRQLDTGAARFTDAAHPDVVVRLDLKCSAEGMGSLETCAVTATQPTAVGDDITLRPVQVRCATCGTLIQLPAEAAAVHCATWAGNAADPA